MPNTPRPVFLCAAADVELEPVRHALSLAGFFACHTPGDSLDVLRACATAPSNSERAMVWLSARAFEVRELLRALAPDVRFVHVSHAHLSQQHAQPSGTADVLELDADALGPALDQLRRFAR